MNNRAPISEPLNELHTHITVIAVLNRRACHGGLTTHPPSLGLRRMQEYEDTI
jgi:hypothetical protein